ncbi:hypothetical protein D7Y24_00320 [Stenotrophomonas maltophilia]|uniref:hypothetical protein n=1 Tax=Stenotrophomonas maltophilia TaxID=40324 RepID=UPI0015DDF386|nr:hypothetical protein [Stenotrophomonas maltophilia]ELN2585907.1 hypothetical protein [Stenotrophomonas maltophilia]ELN2593672.1 hypothetical protein [Stenotrophomonas maltophilia]MBA0296871.1 hypothetical protein [Stenotrophomonas maltophilia]MBH1400910.1 hypothetical protein [Stenotrophomonas maltophilia]MBH1705415.1 hypothetical protein [Stenotrophomonas maltophilia]
MDQSDINMLAAFIESEEAALAEERQGDFYPSYHYQLAALAPRAGNGLPQDMLQRFYFHWLRVGDWKVAGLPQRDFPILVAAYQELTKLPVGYDTRQPGLSLPHLFCFGFNEHGELPSGVVTNAADLKQRTRLVEHCRKYQSFQAQREKVDKFLPYRPFARTILETARFLQHDIKGMGQILYWGMALIALLDEDTRIQMTNDLIARNWPEDRERGHVLSLLHHTAEATRPHCAADAEFDVLCEHLAQLHDTRIMTGDAVQLAQREGWHVDNIRDWNASITLYHGGEYSSEPGHPRIRLDLNSWPDTPWSINLSVGNGSYVAYRDEPTSNDFQLPPIIGATLDHFPEWVKQINARLGINLVPGTGSAASAYKNRTLARQLDAWMRGK